VYCELAHSIRAALRSKRAEDAKRRTDERYRILLESISDSVYVLDREWRHVIVNEAGSRFTHIPVDKLLGNKLTDLFPGVEKTSFFAAFRRVMETRKPETASDKYVFEDGREGWYEVDVYPVPEGILCISSDITEGKKAEMLLRANALILENIADSVIVTDLEGRITSWNEGASKIFGFSAEEMLGENIAKVFKSKERGQVASAQLEQVRKGVLFSTECEGVRKDGESVWLMMTTKLLKNSQGENVGMIGVGKDITERKKAEKETESMAKFPAQNPEPVLRISSDGTLLYANQASQNLLKESQSKKDRTLIETSRRHAADALSSNEQSLFEDEHDGRIFQFNVVPVASEGYANLYVTDITERKQMEKQLKESEEKYRNLVENSQDAIAIVDFKGNVLFANKAAERLTGYALKEGKGLNIRVVTPKRYWPKSVAMLLKARVGKPIPYFEYELKRKDGTVVPVETGGQAIFEDGKPVAIQIITREVTERRKAEQALRESEEKYRSLVELAPDGIVAVNAEGIVTSANRSFLALVGYDSEEGIVGKPFAELVTIQAEDIPRFQEMFSSLMNGKPLSPVEFLYVRRDGTSRWAEVHPGLLVKDGKPVGAQVIMRDISERKNAEKLIQENQQMFEQLFMSNPAAAVYVDQNERVLNVSPRFTELFGYSSDEVKEKFLDDFVVPDDRKKEAIMLAQKGREGYVYYETVRKNKNGALIPVTLSSAPIVLQGKHLGDMVTYMDITERRKAERETKIKDYALASSIVAVAFADLKGNLFYVNNSFLRIWGYANDKEVLGRPSAEFWLHGEKAVEIVKALSDGQGWAGELTAKKKDGSIFDAQLSGSLVKDETGKPLCMMGSFMDVTKRKKVEEELKSSEERLSVLFELAPDAYYLNDLKGNFIDGNKAAEEVTGYTKDELIGKSFLKLKLLPRSQALKAAKLLAMNALGIPTGPDEFVLNRKGGTQIPMEIRTYPVRIKDKTVVLGIARDITIRKKNEQAVRESQQKFEGLFKHNPEATVYLDSDFRILDASPRFCQLFGYSAKEVEGKHINEVVAPEDMMEEAERLNKDAKKGYASRDTVRKRKDGSLVHVSISAAPVSIEDKQLGYVGVYKDITNLKDAEERLREMNMRLEVTNEKLHVVGGLTRHDVRNKLVAVTGNAYLLTQKLVGDAKALGQLNDMEEAVRLVEEIFEFARIYEKLGVEQLTSMDVGKAVEGAVSLFSGLKGVKMVNECRGLTVLADSLLSQLFYNLIDNSLKYGEKTQQIKVYCKTSSSNQLELVYEDDGVGIPDNVRSNLFKEGFTSGKGTGYGLFMIKRICEVYGWTIQEKGTQGKGARFTMSIPRIGSTEKGDYQVQKTQQRQQESATNMEVPKAHSQPHL
jgi:PAS domain S-box-containing protein